ncbi:MAG: 2-hydroxymuconic semialdehyde dehydrogenase [Deltaproteobacteria bacterium CG11_big_fil_rev_8_21_14_0_20_45_16]|nr:MAG: 2-hydroxymuconic semialdehyde dehydrogenase [Deltaproteobacteria bacterium CG11_big_fil_rev_8_21_14_0_20_45_16]
MASKIPEIIPNYIGGEFLPAKEGGKLDVVAPATGKIYAQLSNSSEADLALAIQAAESAQPAWADLKPEERAKYLFKIADLIDANIPEFANLESMDTGKAIRFVEDIEVPRAAANIRFYASAIIHFASESHAAGANVINFTRRDPLGVVACISPWNFPLHLLSWKIAPALAAGNVVIAKPSELSPLTAWRLSEICQEAGLPAGVLNILHGEGGGIGEALISHPRVKAISFTGGTATGRHIASVGAAKLKKVSLELGGKNPLIVFADANLEKAADAAIRAGFQNAGQICLCGSRLLIEQSIYDKFKALLLKRLETWNLGNPSERSTDQGAVISKAHREKILGYIDRAKADGAKILTGGKSYKPSADSQGFFVEPTLIEGLACENAINQEEVFGPVVSLQTFKTEPEALRIANSTKYGLSASIWTQDIGRASRMSKAIEAGIVWVNCWNVRDLRTPFGGVKESGMGREGGWESLRFFTEAKNICIQWEGQA